MISVQKLIISSIFIAIGVIFPMAFHFTGLSGAVFLPMHIPVLIAGMLLGGRAGFAIGVLTPILSSLTTGMPPLMPTLPRMVAELGVYGLAGGYFYKNKNLPVLASLSAAMIVGRLAAFIAGYVLIMFLDLKIDPIIYFKASTLYAAPGIIIQLLLIPFAVKKLEAVMPRATILE